MNPFDLLDEISDATPPGSWALIGGLMVDGVRAIKRFRNDWTPPPSVADHTIPPGP